MADIKLYGTLHNVTGDPAARANEIYDETQEKDQSTINAEVDTALDTVDSRINTAKEQIIGDAATDYDTLGKLEDKIQAEVERATAAEGDLDGTKADKATTLEGYGITDAYTKGQIDNMVSPQHNYITVSTYADLANISEHTAGCVYRVSNYDGVNSQVDATKYSEYGWDGTQYVHLATKSQIGEVFDVSEYNATGGTLATYASLEALLSDANLSTIIPVGVRKGGMSIKFVQGSAPSSDNNYMQYMYNGTYISNTNFTKESNWEKINLDKDLYGETVTYNPDGNIRPLSKSLVEGDVVYSIGDATQVNLYDSNNTLVVNLTSSLLPYTVTQTISKAGSYLIGGNLIINGELNKPVLRPTDIVDRLTSTDAKKVLSAKQGKNLNDRLMPIETSINGKTLEFRADGNIRSLPESLESGDVITELNTRVSLYNGSTPIVTLNSSMLPYTVNTTIDKAAAYIASTGAMATITIAGDFENVLRDTDVINNLTSTQTTKPLSAKQGKILKELIDNIVSDNIKIGVPDIINAVVGDTYQIYFESIFLCNNYTNYDIGVTCNIGHLYPRYYEVTPTASQVGNHTITFTIKDNNNNLLGTKQCTLVVSAKAISPQSSVDVLIVGSSLSSPGKWEAELKRRLTGSGGTPVADGLSNINFIGRINRTIDGTSINFEATGGYGIRNYIQTGRMLYKFNFTAQSPAGACSIGDVYSINTRQYTITEINLTEGVGNISCTSEGTTEISGSGTLTKVSGSGADTLSYTSSAVTGNPFVNNGEIDFQWYANTYGNGKIDIVSISEMILSELVNFGDNSQYITNFSDIFTRMKTFMDNVLADFPSCKFVIFLPAIVDKRGGLGANYIAGQYIRYGIKTSLINLVQTLEDYIDTNNLGDTLYLVNTLGETDCYNDYLQTNKKVNPRSNVTEIVGTNGFHPSDVGYMQFADSAYRCFVANLL